MGMEYLWGNQFKYLCLFIQKDEQIDSGINNKIQAGWLKWRSATTHRGVIITSLIIGDRMLGIQENSLAQNYCGGDVHALLDVR